MVACSIESSQTQDPTIDEATEPTLTPIIPTPSQPTRSTPDIAEQTADVFYGLTYINPDGNRVISGSGLFPVNEPIDIPLPGKPVWLVATSANDGIFWTAAMEDGSITAIHMFEKGDFTPIRFQKL